MSGMGTVAGKDLARKLLEAWVQSPAQSMVSAYGERLARYPADTAVRAVNWMIDNMESKPSIAALHSAIQNHSEAPTEEAVEEADPFADMPLEEQVALLDRGIEYLLKIGIAETAKIITLSRKHAEELRAEIGGRQ